MMVGEANAEIINTGNMTYFLGFSLLLAGLAVFAITFAALFILKWKYRYWFKSAYRVQNQDLNSEYKRVKLEDGESSDEEKMDELLNSYHQANVTKIGEQ